MKNLGHIILENINQNLRHNIRKPVEKRFLDFTVSKALHNITDEKI